MTWYYSQSTGHLTRNSKTVSKSGYSGSGKGKNNPKMQDKSNVGPIPRGNWTIGKPRDTKNHGPHVMDLTPNAHSALGRTEFLIHGDSVSHPGTASQGCIILPRNIREKISGSGDHALVVTE